jgi:hypothetical protein
MNQHRFNCCPKLFYCGKVNNRSTTLTNRVLLLKWLAGKGFEPDDGIRCPCAIDFLVKPSSNTVEITIKPPQIGETPDVHSRFFYLVIKQLHVKIRELVEMDNKFRFLPAGDPHASGFFQLLLVHRPKPAELRSCHNAGFNKIFSGTIME